MDAAWAHGYAAVRVHGRTVEQKYQGRAGGRSCAKLKRRYPDRTILGQRRRVHGGGRGADAARDGRGHRLDRPRRDREPVDLRPRAAAAARSRTRSFNPPTIDEQREALAEHFAIAMEIHGEQLAGRRMRKMGIKYSRFHPEAAEVKAEFIDVQQPARLDERAGPLVRRGRPGRLAGGERRTR